MLWAIGQGALEDSDGAMMINRSSILEPGTYKWTSTQKDGDPLRVEVSNKLINTQPALLSHYEQQQPQIEFETNSFDALDTVWMPLLPLYGVHVLVVVPGMQVCGWLSKKIYKDVVPCYDVTTHYS